MYYAYPDEQLIFFINFYDNTVSSIMVTEGGELYGVKIGMTFDQIKDILGPPDIEDYD